jgi:hypothetical protein
MESNENEQTKESFKPIALTPLGHGVIDHLERGKLSLRTESSETGVLSSLSVIRKHILGLDTTDLASFTFNLGAVIEFLDMKFLRSAIMLGQNPKILEWLHKYIQFKELQLPIVKVVGLISVTAKFSKQIDEQIRELFLPHIYQLIKETNSKKRRPKRLTLENIDDIDMGSNEVWRETSKPVANLIEEVDPIAGLLMYCTLIVDKSKQALTEEEQVLLAEDLLCSLDVISPAFAKVVKGDLKTALNTCINKVLKWIASTLPVDTIILKLPDFMMLSLVFQQKTDFVYTLQGQLEEVIKNNKEKASLVLMDLLSDKADLRNYILAHCTKLRSVLFVSTLCTSANPQLTKYFFKAGGRQVYMQILARHMKTDKIPNVYIFLEDEELVQSMTSEEEILIKEVVNRITNSGVIRYQLSDRMTNFNKALKKRLAGQNKLQPEFTLYSKVFKAKETAEIVMKGIVNNIWKENSAQSNNLIIEVKNKKKRRSVEIELMSPGASSVKSGHSGIKSTKSGKSFFFNDTMDEEPSESQKEATPLSRPKAKLLPDSSPPQNAADRPKKQKSASLYSYDCRRELSTRDIANLMDSFYQFNAKSRRIEMYRGKETRLVYHRRMADGKGLYFALLEVNNGVDLILLNAVVYSPHMRKVFVNSNVKTMERLNVEGRPFYEQDFVTLCTTKTSSGREDHLIVILDKQQGVNKLLYKPLLQKGQLQEYPNFEELFASYGTHFDSMRSLTLSSGLGAVLVGCRHLLAVFSANNNSLAFSTMVSDIGFTLSRIRLLDKASSTFLVLGYVAREFNIINLSHKKIYNFVFEWLEANQLISEVEIDENIMVYLIEDSKRKHSSIYIRDNDSFDDQGSLDDHN